MMSANSPRRVFLVESSIGDGPSPCPVDCMSILHMLVEIILPVKRLAINFTTPIASFVTAVEFRRLAVMYIHVPFESHQVLVGFLAFAALMSSMLQLLVMPKQLAFVVVVV